MREAGDRSIKVTVFLEEHGRANGFHPIWVSVMSRMVIHVVSGVVLTMTRV
jgi:hypothetical protein